MAKIKGWTKISFEPRYIAYTNLNEDKRKKMNQIRNETKEDFQTIEGIVGVKFLLIKGFRDVDSLRYESSDVKEVWKVYLRKGREVNQLGKQYYTKQQALDYAREYMRLNP